ncbi:hypothetical protein PWR63_23780 [Paraburkholderia sp. A2WS-5]|uniref:hypothetical protein n=1 Tax=Paraburkholderia sp. A2WS-5 TaxID=3028372 RepID=UPI003B8058A4
MGTAKGKSVNKRGFKVQPAPVPSSSASRPNLKRGAAALRGWNIFWGVVGPLATAISLWAYFAPSIAITPGDNLDPQQEFQTQFVVANKGNFSLYNMRFACSIVGQSVYIKDLQFSPETLKPIPKLESGGVASRGCFEQSRVPVGRRLKVDVYYNWPSFAGESTQSAYFRVERGASGNFLVPDDGGAPADSGSAVKIAPPATQDQRSQ